MLIAKIVADKSDFVLLRFIPLGTFNLHVTLKILTLLKILKLENEVSALFNAGLKVIHLH